MFRRPSRLPDVHRAGCAALFAAVLAAGCAAEATSPLPVDGGTSSTDASGADREALDAEPLDAAPVSDAGLAVDAALEGPSFTEAVWPLMTRACVGCHFVSDLPPQLFMPEQAYRGLLDGRSPTVNLRWVEPGAPERSYLLHKLQGSHATVGGRGTIMPPMFEGEPRPTPPEELAAVRAWIETGARGP